MKLVSHLTYLSSPTVQICADYCKLVQTVNMDSSFGLVFKFQLITHETRITALYLITNERGLRTSSSQEVYNIYEIQSRVDDK